MGAQKPTELPVWCASVRMLLVSVAGVVAAGLIASGITGCADMSGIAPQSSLRAAALPVANASAASGTVAAEWWRDFGDETLNGLVAKSLQTSPNLKLAQARLARAQAVGDAAAAATLPQINGQLDLTRQRYTGNGAVPPPLAGAVRSSGTAQLAASWELDFFGRNRAALDATLGNARAAQADAQAARVLLASQVARTYFQLVRLNEQAAVAERTLAQRQETLKLVRDRVNAGLDTRLELQQSEGGLPEARLQIEMLQEQMALTRNALLALTGEQNSTSALVPSAQAAIKAAAPAPVIPADLLGRRADIAAARWRVEASSQDVANAKTQFYPNINLAAFAGFSSIGLGRLLDAGSQQWGVAPALRLPVFEAGRLRANLRGRTADLDAAVESYNAAVVDAVREVADQVASSRAIVRQQAHQLAAQGAAESAYDIALQRYRAGLGNYLNVLTAETSVLAQRRLAVDLTARTLETQVALIRALGGGYAPEPLPVATPSAAL
ncbi:MAG: efflux system, outer rane lipoprotein NodT family [Polaromonas sp.]|jgi:NodT family efflux transporter outer membrane factor (OMF) lipoprotein|nr:efflux system, outer rane lipoprotein NodT family [Polaromonas sp.]